ncbi:MAG TPA: glycosyltransferase family 2 protein [Ignavibacteria bacterium]|nr:glycosyltransferase family 2 protein [Ignavibacteria bacterium]
MNPVFSIIIINFRQKEFTQNCVRSVYEKIEASDFEVIIINNSPEDDLSELEKEYQDIVIISNSNRGFSQANNLGASRADGKYLFFLNADTVLRSDFTADFLKEFKSREFGAVGLKLFNTDGTFQLSSGKIINFLNEIKNKKEELKFRERDIPFIEQKEKDMNHIIETDWVTGAAMIIKKDEFIKSGGFDETYFLYYEDADICKRLKDAGFKNYFYPFSDIVHIKGENAGADFVSVNYFNSKRSQLLYYKKHNNVIENIILRAYLFLKFSVKYILTFNKIYLSIVKLTLGIPVNEYR